MFLAGVIGFESRKEGIAMYRFVLMSLSGLMLLGLAACGDNGGGNGGATNDTGTSGTTAPATPPAQ